MPVLTSPTLGTTSGDCSPLPASRPACLTRASSGLLLDLGYGLTNAAPRTTRGSGDLRRADFAGSAERLEQIVAELCPEGIAFVGKAAYEGAFRERPALGLQDRRLADTWLFVLPSTSPANAAVPYEDRLGGSTPSTTTSVIRTSGRLESRPRRVLRRPRTCRR